MGLCCPRGRNGAESNHKIRMLLWTRHTDIQREQVQSSRRQCGLSSAGIRTDLGHSKSQVFGLPILDPRVQNLPSSTREEDGTHEPADGPQSPSCPRRARAPPLGRPADTSRHLPLELMVPSSYFFTNTKSTKSLGEISFMAAEGVEVLLTHSICRNKTGSGLLKTSPTHTQQYGGAASRRTQRKSGDTWALSSGCTEAK